MRHYISDIQLKPEERARATYPTAINRCSGVTSTASPSDAIASPTMASVSLDISPKRKGGRAMSKTPKRLLTAVASQTK